MDLSMVLVKAWTGSEWKTSDLGEAVLWNGSAWTYPRLKYWDGSGWVQSVGIPESQLSFADFAFDQTVTSGVALTTNGNVDEILTVGTSTRSTWINTSSVNGSVYEVYANVNSGSVSGSATGTWLALSTQRSWEVSSYLSISQAQLTLYIRPTGASANSSQTVVYLSAESVSSGGGGFP